MKGLRKTFETLRETFGGYGKYLFVLTILGIAGAAFEGVGVNVAIPLFSFLIGAGESLPTDFISRGARSLFEFIGIPFSLKFLLAFIVILLLLRAVALMAFSYIRARIMASFTYREVNSLFSGTLCASWPFLSGQRAGYLQNTIFWDVKQSSSLLDAIAQLTQSATGFVVYFLIAFSISPTIMLITIATGAVLLALLGPLVRKTVVLGEERGNLEKSFANLLAEHIVGLKTVKASGVADKVVEAGRGFLDRLRIVHTKSAVMHSFGNVFIQPFSFVFIIVLFAFVYNLPGFNIAAFIAVLYLIQKVFVYLQSAQSTLHSIADFIPFASNISRFKSLLDDNNEELSMGSQPFSFRKELRFDKVSFSYKYDRPVLSYVSLNIPKGSVVGIIGPSGGGKTSIVDLLLRLLQPSDGDILIDGVPINEIRLVDWQKHVGYVSQNIFLMNASVRENIRFYDDSIKDEDIEKSARQANIYDFIKKLDHGFDTTVGDHGVSLSGGQRQRIVLARALARKPKILILDEATSSLDSESENAIRKTISEIKGAVTLIVIAHRISTVTDADKLIVLEDGTVAEEGAPSDMLKNKNSYIARMASMQSLGNFSDSQLGRSAQ